MLNVSFVLFQAKNQNRANFNHSLRGDDFGSKYTSTYNYISPSRFTSDGRKCDRPLGVSTLMYKPGKRCKGMSDLFDGMAIVSRDAKVRSLLNSPIKGVEGQSQKFETALLD